MLQTLLYLFPMRKFFTGLLMLLMLTPSLVCAMPVCAEPAKAASTEQPCAEHVKNHGNDTDGKKKQVNFLQDCTGVDLQMAFAPSIEKPDTYKDFIFTAFDVPSMTTWSFGDTVAMRGPPPFEWRQVSQSHLPVFLTTQRIRV